MKNLQNRDGCVPWRRQSHTTRLESRLGSVVALDLPGHHVVLMLAA